MAPWKCLAGLAGLLVLAPVNTAWAQYNRAAGRSAPRETVGTDSSGTLRVSQGHPQNDPYGNAQGNQYDLAVDGAFEGQTIAVLQLYSEPRFDFAAPRQALREKGFSVYRWINQAPPVTELSAALERANQLWVISDAAPHLTAEHLEAIKRFFEAGHGVYIWGDNEPYYADANLLSQKLLGVQMHGNIPGDVVVGLQVRPNTRGVLVDHLLTTGLEHLYEGITIATIDENQALTPMLYGSAGNLVASFYDRDGRRAILDGGFTRLYMRWDTAGTARYVKNAAAWLANTERFGTSVQQSPVQQPTTPRTGTPQQNH